MTFETTLTPTGSRTEVLVAGLHWGWVLPELRAVITPEETVRCPAGREFTPWAALVLSTRQEMA